VACTTVPAVHERAISKRSHMPLTMAAARPSQIRHRLPAPSSSVFPSSLALASALVLRAERARVLDALHVLGMRARHYASLFRNRLERTFAHRLCPPLTGRSHLEIAYQSRCCASWPCSTATVVQSLIASTSQTSHPPWSMWYLHTTQLRTRARNKIAINPSHQDRFLFCRHVYKAFYLARCL